MRIGLRTQFLACTVHQARASRNCILVAKSSAVCVQEPDVVYLVGTAHVSRQSGEDVQRVIQAVRPQNVVVELCSSRTAIMYDSAGDPSDGGSSSTSSQATDASDSAAALAERRASSAGAGASDQHSRASNPMALR